MSISRLSQVLRSGITVAGFLACTLTLTVAGQPSPGSLTTRLHVSEDGHHLLHSDGSPFFWLGDTAWELFHRLDREEAGLYLEDRARKGFTVIQAVVLAELDGLHTPNPYGHTPLIDDDPTRPNEAYFEHVDYIVDRAADLGLFIGMLPTWGDKFNKKWGVGPEIFTPENARLYGEFLGRRYKDQPIIWILGGDRNPEEDEDLAIIRAMAEGLNEGGDGAHLTTYHPQGGSKSYEWFHDDAWLDLNLHQSGHGAKNNPNYSATRAGYALTPSKPVIDGEPNYEDHPVNWNSENGWFDAFDVRQAAYWSMLSGAAGHTYGNHNIWQMWQPDREPISSARTSWREALAHPGAAQMGFMRRLFESRPWQRLVPDPSLLADPGDETERQVAARASDGSLLLAYTPHGRPITVHLEKLTADSLAAWWFDPRTGVATQIGMLPGRQQHTFDPPGTAARGNDWVLVLDDVRRPLAPPGYVVGRSTARQLGALREALLFYAPFDNGADAEISAGDPRLYHLPPGEETPRPGLPGTASVRLAPGEGRFGGALRFDNYADTLVTYRDARNLGYRANDWSGTISFWLRTEPDEDLRPGEWSDPIHITPKSWDDAALFVDFTRHDVPRIFRFAAIADRDVWNPEGIDWFTELPPEDRPMVVVEKPPFGRDRWTHVVLTFDRFNTGAADGVLRGYLNGRPAGTLADREQTFTWDADATLISLGLQYVGYMDDLAFFNRALTGDEVAALYALDDGIRSLLP